MWQISLGLWQLNVLLGDGLMNDRIVSTFWDFLFSNLICSTQLLLKEKSILGKVA